MTCYTLAVRTNALQVPDVVTHQCRRSGGPAHGPVGAVAGTGTKIGYEVQRFIIEYNFDFIEQFRK